MRRWWHDGGKREVMIYTGGIYLELSRWRRRMQYVPLYLYTYTYKHMHVGVGESSGADGFQHPCHTISAASLQNRFFTITPPSPNRPRTSRPAVSNPSRPISHFHLPGASAHTKKDFETVVIYYLLARK